MKRTTFTIEVEEATTANGRRIRAVCSRSDAPQLKAVITHSLDAPEQIRDPDGYKRMAASKFFAEIGASLDAAFKDVTES